MKELGDVDLLILNDFETFIIDPDQGWDLPGLVDGREGRKTTVLISQCPAGSWYGQFADRKFADAFLNRIMQNVHRIAMGGESRRHS